MKLQSVTMYRIYITADNDSLIENIVFKLKKKYGIDKVIIKRSKNVRNFIYMEIESPKISSKEKIEEVFREEGIRQIKIDVTELKKLL